MIWLTLACVFGTAFNHVIRNAQARGRNMAWVGAWNYLFAALACWAWWAIGPAAPLSRDAVILGLLSGFFYAAGYPLRHICFRAAGVGITTAVNQVSVAIPIAASILIWAEIPGILQAFGIALTLVAFPFLACGRALPGDPRHPGKIWLLGVSFVVQGIATLFMKAYSQGCPPHSPPSAQLPFLCFLFTACAAANLAFAARRGQSRLLDCSHGLALGAVNVFSTFFFMCALAALPGTVVFLTTSVGTMLLSAAAAVVLWRERYHGRALAGLIIAAIALALVNLKL